jgi:hypothetical protein
MIKLELLINIVAYILVVPFVYFYFMYIKLKIEFYDNLLKAFLSIVSLKKIKDNGNLAKKINSLNTKVIFLFAVIIFLQIILMEH